MSISAHRKVNQMIKFFDEARAYLYVSDNFGGNIDLKPQQAMELLDFLLQNAEDIRGYIQSNAGSDTDCDNDRNCICPLCLG
jgi:hypothetical protein